MESFEEACKAAFQQFSQQDVIPSAMLGQAARLAGASPSNAEIEQCNRQLGSGGCNFSKFQAFCEKTLHREDDLKDIAEIFRSADIADSGSIPRTTLKAMVQTFGEPLSDSEFDVIARSFCNPANGDIGYIDMLTQLFQSGIQFTATKKFINGN